MVAQAYNSSTWGAEAAAVHSSRTAGLCRDLISQGEWKGKKIIKVCQAAHFTFFLPSTSDI